VSVPTIRPGVDRGSLRSASDQALEHDPERWIPDFGKDHAPPIG
jgi:hypothetical protein